MLVPGGPTELDRISGPGTVQILVPRHGDTRGVLLRHARGNIRCSSGRDFAMQPGCPPVLLTEDGAGGFVAHIPAPHRRRVTRRLNRKQRSALRRNR